MRKALSFLAVAALVGVIKAQGEALPADSDAQVVIDLGVAPANQVKYIRDLSKFYFSKVKWYRKFRFYQCPEFETLVVNTNEICPMWPMPPLEPLFPLTRCDVNPSLTGCPRPRTDGSSPSGTGGSGSPPGTGGSTGPTNPGGSTGGSTGPTNPNGSTGGTSSPAKPDCNDPRKLCGPPIYCDWPENRYSAECIAPFDCAANPNAIQCQIMSKCDLESYNKVEGCVKKETCVTNPKLCLTPCDTLPGKFKRECLVESCLFFPQNPICEKVLDCIPKTNCEGDKLFTEPDCCPNKVCPPKCDNPPCDTPVDPPPKLCSWGYKLGNNLISYLADPVERQTMGVDNVVQFIECFTNVTQTTDSSLELECFYNGMQNGFTAVANNSTQAILEATRQNWQVVDLKQENKTYQNYTLEKKVSKEIKAN